MERLAKKLTEVYDVDWKQASTIMVEWAAERLAKEIGYAEAAAEMKEMNRRREELQLNVDCPLHGTELWREYVKLK
jgi:predicted Ser/Thr protein kinase